tara:strand:+ start:29 stop:721 length:693 start_codon:yes stop_codon:yes gene_type:complete
MRRHDKTVSMLKANILFEQRCLDDLNTITEDDFKEFYNECKLYENIDKDKKNINESLGMLALGFILSAGKLMDLVGVIYKKINNFFSKKKIDKTKLEKFGEKYNSYIVKGIKFIIKKSVGGKISDETAEIWANILFTIIIISLFGVGSASMAAGNYAGAALAVKSATQLVKLYELGVVFSAVVLYVTVAEIRAAGPVTKVPHAVEACVTEDKGVTDEGRVKCIISSMEKH